MEGSKTYEWFKISSEEMFRKWGYSNPKVVWRTNRIDQADEAMGQIKNHKTKV